MRRTLLIIGLVGALLITTAIPASAHARARRYEVDETSPAGATPHFPAFDPSTGNVLVSNVAAGTVSEIDPGVGVVRSFVAGRAPHTVVIDDETRRALVVNKGSATVSVFDLSDTQTAAIATFAVGPNPHGLVLDGERGRIYVTSIDADSVEAYDLATYAFIDAEAVGPGPWGVDVRDDTIAVTATGGTTIHVLDADTFETTRVIEVGAGPWNVKIGPSGTMYATLERSDEVVAVTDGHVAWRAAVGDAPHGIVQDEARDVVLAAVTGSDTVVVIGARKGNLYQSLAVADGPAGLAYDHNDGHAYVGNQGAGVVSTLSPKGRGR